MLNLIANLIGKFRFCQYCMDRTDQLFRGKYWECLTCKKHLDRDGKVMK